MGLRAVLSAAAGVLPLVARVFCLGSAFASIGGSLAAGTAEAKPIVIFFGGYASTEKDMRAWLAAARRDPVYGQSFAFEAIAYPSHASVVERDANRAAAATIKAIAGRIDANPGRAFIVVGHSSGAAIAASVVERIRSRKNIKLVILDDGVDEGFQAPSGFDTLRQIECWSVVNGPLESFNRGPAMAFCRNYHELQAQQCRTDVCLHFAIVNSGVAADLSEKTAFVVAKDGSTRGYQNLKVNLSWLASSIGV